MTDSNISSREQNQYQKQLSIGNGATHNEQYPYLSDISQLLHRLSILELEGLCTLQEMLLAKSFWEATNYSGSQEKCKKRLTELYGEDWDEHVKFRDHFVSIKRYYVWALLISHRQQWNQRGK
tara:strand:+ start:1264 stop:1632 length:369 start_codon:yes stop_codon:yes gene_type:complete